MTLILEHHGLRYAADLPAARSIAIALDFDGIQPSHFGANRASRHELRLGDFVGRTEQGGSCNVDTVQMVPHCNGTHTETVSHIVNEEIWIGHAALDVVCLAALISVPTVSAGKTNETYRPELDATDRVVTASSVRSAIQNHAGAAPAALIIRTRPNESDKRSRAYSSENNPAFFTIEAMKLIVEQGCRHLLVDLPSVDRMYDDGLLTNHHLFWNVPEGTHALNAECFQDRTITEMIFVENDIPDGLYLLNMQVPAFCSDAAPSRPVIIPVTSSDVSRETSKGGSLGSRSADGANDRS